MNFKFNEEVLFWKEFLKIKVYLYKRIGFINYKMVSIHLNVKRWLCLIGGVLFMLTANGFYLFGKHFSYECEIKEDS